MDPRALRIDTKHGPALAHLHGSGPRLLVLGHGAGGGVAAPDLQAVATAVAGDEWTVVLVEQPYRVAGRRAPAPAGQLDRAFVEVVQALRGAAAVLVTGGRSSGARVACRTSAALGCEAVVALAFPLRPPGRAADRTPELRGLRCPVLVVQGERDPFGSAATIPLDGLPVGSAVRAVAGADHAFRARRADGRSAAECAAEAGSHVRDWLQSTLT